MNGWLALAIVVGASIALKILKKKGIIPEDSGSHTVTVSQSHIYKVRLIDAGPYKVKAIKVYRDLTGEGLKEAKDMIDSAPCIMLVTEDYEKASRMVQEFRAISASVSIEE